MPRRSPICGYYARRYRVLERDNFICQHCGQRAPNVVLEVDHIIPVSEGGTDDFNNLTTSCKACNMGKSALSIIIKRRGKKNVMRYLEPKTKRLASAFKMFQLNPDRLFAPDDIGKALNISRNYADVILKRLLFKKLVIRSERGRYKLNKGCQTELGGKPYDKGVGVS